MRHRDGRPNCIHQHQDVDVFDARHHDNGDEAAGDGAPDRQATLPDLERADDAAFAPLVAREQVVQPSADDTGDDHGNRDLRDDLRVTAHAAPPHLRDLRGGENTEREHQPVRVQRQGPDVDDPVFRAREKTGQRDRHRAIVRAFKPPATFGRCCSTFCLARLRSYTAANAPVKVGPTG